MVYWQCGRATEREPGRKASRVGQRLLPWHIFRVSVAPPSSTAPPSTHRTQQKRHARCQITSSSRPTCFHQTARQTIALCDLEQPSLGSPALSPARPARLATDTRSKERSLSPAPTPTPTPTARASSPCGSVCHGFFFSGWYLVLGRASLGQGRAVL